MTKKKRPEATTSAGEFRWFRNWIALKEGGHHHEWRIARLLLNGQVEVYGPVLTLDADNRYLDRVIWGPTIIPPPAEEAASSVSLVPSRNRQKRRNPQSASSHAEEIIGAGSKALTVAQGIVDAFVETVPVLDAYYGQRAGDRDALIRRLARLIEEAMT
jgi:hypothetical protein